MNEHSYNIRIRTKSETEPPEIRSKISLDFLEEMIVVPYRSGRSIVLDGRIISVFDIWSINIRRTKNPSSNRPFWKRLLTRLAPEVSDDNFDYIGEDVTSEFILGAPGTGVAKTSYPPIKAGLPANSRDVFVVHGRNRAARDAMFTFLRSIGLNPLEWSEAVRGTQKASPYVGEVLDAAFSKARAVVVLFTPDDEAKLKEVFWDENEPVYEVEATGQARPNVLFEAGMAMGRAEKSTILVELGDVRPFSDVGGRHVIRLNNTIAIRRELAQRLQATGCPIALDGTTWQTAGDFEASIAILGEKITKTSAPTNQTVSSANEEPQLSEDATELLIEASQDPSAMILKVRTLGGTKIQTNGKLFGERGNRRSEARWEQAIRELQYLGLVEDRSGRDQGFAVTYLGFQVAGRMRTII